MIEIRMGRGFVIGGCIVEGRFWCYRMEEVLRNEGYVRLFCWF